MILTYHGPRLSLSERIAAHNLPIVTPAHTLRQCIDIRAWTVKGMGLDKRLIARDSLEQELDRAFSRDQITFGEATELLARVRNQIPL